MGPKLMLSDKTTAEQPVLRWRLRVRGNTAVEFGIIPVNLPRTHTALHKCQGVPDAPDERCVGFCSQITAGSLLPLKAPVMRGTILDITARRGRLEIILNYPKDAKEISWHNGHPVQRPYRGPSQLRFEQDFPNTYDVQLAVTSWAKATFEVLHTGHNAEEWLQNSSSTGANNSSSAAGDASIVGAQQDQEEQRENEAAAMEEQVTAVMAATAPQQPTSTTTTSIMAEAAADAADAAGNVSDSEATQPVPVTQGMKRSASSESLGSDLGAEPAASSLPELAGDIAAPGGSTSPPSSTFGTSSSPPVNAPSSALTAALRSASSELPKSASTGTLSCVDGQELL